MFDDNKKLKNIKENANEQKSKLISLKDLGLGLNNEQNNVANLSNTKEELYFFEGENKEKSADKYVDKHDAIAFELGLSQNVEENFDQEEEILWAVDEEKNNKNDENMWGLTLPQDRESLMKGL